MSNGQDLVYFNGINGLTGDYDLPPMSAEDMLPLVQKTDRPDNFVELQWRYRQRMASYLGVREGIDPTHLGEAGWGVIFAHDADPAIVEALNELLELRHDQATKFFKIYQGSEGYRPGESKSKFLARHGAGLGPADPYKVPYYLLIVGSPQAIPYEFQNQLSVQYAVGRIHFQTPEEYSNYARTVLKAEKEAFDLPPLATFFNVTHPDDPVTQLSNDFLIQPLLKEAQSARSDRWEFQELSGDQASKDRLAALLGNQPTPAFLFTAGHGISFPDEHLNRPLDQGALLCADWPGPQQDSGSVDPQTYFSAADLSPATNLQGMIAFFTSSYGIGVPSTDFPQWPGDPSGQPQPSVSSLPQKMLGLQEGGALAVIGQIGRAPAFSSRGAQTTTFESVLRRLLAGDPVGYAMEYFNERYAELSVELTDELEEISFGKMSDPDWLVSMWSDNNYTHNFKIFADPAVRLPFERSRRSWS